MDVFTRAGQVLCTYSKQVTNTYRHADSQSRGTLQVITFVVAGCKHSEDQLEGDEEFYNQGTSHRDACIYLCRQHNSRIEMIL